jgi:tetratricopeptide (TPR) repeat protein
LVDFNEDDAISRGVYFQPIGWEETLGGIGRPQSIINKDLQTCDYFVMILWDTWGSPPGGDEERARTHSSGTEEEYHIALECHADPDQPMRQLVVFFKGVEPRQLSDPGTQLSRVLDFKKNLETNRTLLFQTFDEKSDFQSQLRRHLYQWVRDHTAGGRAEDRETPLSSPEPIETGDLHTVIDGLRPGDSELAGLIADAKRHANDGELVEAETLFAKALTNRSVTGDVYVAYGDYLLRVGRIAAARVMYERASEQAAEDTEAAATAQVRLGDIARTRGDLDDAVERYQAAKDLAERNQIESVVAYAHRRLGNVAYRRGDFDEAEQLCRKSLEIYERLDRQEGIAAAYRNLGNVAYRRGDFDEAEQLCRKSLAIYERLGDQEGIAAAYRNLGNVAYRRGDFDEAEQLYRKSLAINERLGRQEGIAKSYNNLGNVAHSRGEWDEAEELHRKSLEINERLGDQDGIAKSYNSLGNVAKSRGVGRLRSWIASRWRSRRRLGR